MYFEKLWNSFAALPEVSAIALGGSRATGKYDEKSDYDLYIYCDSVPDDQVRRAILEETCRYIEQGNAFWELEDDCTLKDGVDIDILYRDLDGFTAGLHDVVEECHPYNGYTTCMWHNLLTCKILYDRDGALAGLKERFDIPYPEALRKNIIERGMRLLHGYLPSYDGQIMKAAKRGDLVAVNHRAAAYLESYFDVIFALNRMTHPGEKRMTETALREAAILPKDFSENIDRLLKGLFTSPEALAEILSTMTENLRAVVEAE